MNLMPWVSPRFSSTGKLVQSCEQVGSPGTFTARVGMTQTTFSKMRRLGVCGCSMMSCCDFSRCLVRLSRAHESSCIGNPFIRSASWRLKTKGMKSGSAGGVVSSSWQFALCLDWLFWHLLVGLDPQKRPDRQLFSLHRENNCRSFLCLRNCLKG